VRVDGDGGGPGHGATGRHGHGARGDGLDAYSRTGRPGGQPDLS
jgi:hypothetical protein